jgi:hypothetical protein
MRLHLPTCFVAMLQASTLLYLNTRPVTIETKPNGTEGQYVDLKLIQPGWPRDILEFQDVVTEDEATQIKGALRRDRFPEKQQLVANIFWCLAILAVSTYLIEKAFCRLLYRERSKLTQIE